MTLPHKCWLKAVRHQAWMTPGPVASISFTPGFLWLSRVLFCFVSWYASITKEYKILDHISIVYSLFTRIFLPTLPSPQSSPVMAAKTRHWLGTRMHALDPRAWEVDRGALGVTETNRDHMRLLSQRKEKKITTSVLPTWQLEPRSSNIILESYGSSEKMETVHCLVVMS